MQANTDLAILYGYLKLTSADLAIAMHNYALFAESVDEAERTYEKARDNS